MRVLIVSQYFWPENFRINDIAQKLVESGNHVEVLTGFPNYPNGVFYEGYKVSKYFKEEHNGIIIHRVKIKERGTGRSDFRLVPNYLSFVRNGNRFIKKHHKELAFDVSLVFAVSPITQAYPALKLKKLKGTKCAMYLYDLWPDTLFSHNIRNKVVKAMLTKICSNIYKRCDFIFCTSTQFSNRLQSMGVENKRIEYLPQWAEEHYLSCESSGLLRLKLNIKNDSFVVMYAGNIGNAQNVLDIVKAAEKVPSISFVFVGDGTCKKECEEYCFEHGINNCFFIGLQSNASMPSIIAESDAMIVSLKDRPNYNLTLPGRVQSFMKCGKPILVYAKGETASIIETAKCGVVVDDISVESLVLSLKKMLAVPKEELKNMGNNAVDYCLEHFDSGSLLKRMEKSLNELC